MRKRHGSYPRVRVEGGGRGVVSQARAVPLIETVRDTGLDQATSAALAPWGGRGRCDPGEVLLETALAVAPAGDCLADVGTLRAEPGAFGPVAALPKPGNAGSGTATDRITTTRLALAHCRRSTGAYAGP